MKARRMLFLKSNKIYWWFGQESSSRGAIFICTFGEADFEFKYFRTSRKEIQEGDWNRRKNGSQYENAAYNKSPVLASAWCSASPKKSVGHVNTSVIPAKRCGKDFHQILVKQWLRAA